MRILIVNKFWYPRGGDCVVAMATAEMLRRMGHKVAVFTMDYPSNADDSNVAGVASGVRFDGSVAERFKAVRRALTGAGVEQPLTRVLEEFSPKVVHLHNVHSYLSPVVARLAHEHGCRVVWTMHDYKLLCPAYTCLRDRKPCCECIERPLEVVNHRCMKHSMAASFVGLLEATQWNMNRLIQWVDTFICPSAFMAQMLRRVDVPESHIAVIPNCMPADRAKALGEEGERADYCCYVGRLSSEKGLRTLLKAASDLPFTLRVAGDGPLLGELRHHYGHCRNIELLGRLDAPHVAELLQKARFSVVPSQWWENCPMGVVESLCAGTPVVATRMGGIPELVDDSCGLLVQPNDATALAEAMCLAWEHPWNHVAIAREATERFHEQHYYRRLMQAYQPIPGVERHQS